MSQHKIPADQAAYTDPLKIEYWQYAQTMKMVNGYADLCGLTVKEFMVYTPKELLSAYEEHQGSRRFFSPLAE